MHIYEDAYVYIILTIDDTEMTSFLDFASDCDPVHLQASLVTAELRPRPGSQEVGVSRGYALLLLRSVLVLGAVLVAVLGTVLGTVIVLLLDSAPASDDKHCAGDFQPRQGGHSRGADTVPGPLGSVENYRRTTYCIL